ncbi:pectinesterase family protein [Kribbella albertanoniae]|uniref:Pectate lyase domain-containing protein n=1 Tax=Kribbella albertanoniae TaxID=1266829 RepID=A0A4R4PKV3_9ACTN|nr:pectinesterase family protein [Kribbella albertanoniae]TDC22646.1 hypothetical protein E1261_30365 [Kribbella albertanoniae]
MSFTSAEPKPRLLLAACALSLVGGLVTAVPQSAAAQPAPIFERQPLAPGDGWASTDGGTSGGAAATKVVTVDNRDELAAAVQGDEPKIVRVAGTIDGNRRADGTAISCADYQRDGYTLEKYLEAFDPAHWTGPAAGPMELARKASATAQAQQVKIKIGANTTLIGVGRSTLTGLEVDIEKVSNVIIRNLRISDAYDCFPLWNGETWKTEYDNLVVSGATRVWLDHLTLDDGKTVDTEQPKYFGQYFLRHDGLLDVVRQADLVTISWSRLVGHDKSMLWGNGDNVVADRGKIRVTLHHNEFVDLVQRAPRVRYGQALVYNNLYRVTDPEHYEYSWGVGVESSITARQNTFELADGVAPAEIIYNWGGTGIDASGTWVNGRETDVLAAYNTANPGTPLAASVPGSAGPHGVIQPAKLARQAVQSWAGAGRLPFGLDPTDPAVAGAALLKAMRAPSTSTADGPVWSPLPTGFASTADAAHPRGTTGGTGGRTVTVTTASALAAAAASPEPLTILVNGEIAVQPWGSMITVAANKTIAGIGRKAGLVGGGLFVDRVDNVIIRNLVFRDSYIPGDWDGKRSDNDNDGIRIDTSSHVWIDHNEFARLGDGLVDVRKDSTAITLSWNVFRDNNKAIGVGWTTNVLTTITLHHNWITNTYQRNASIDNVLAGHLYNNYLDGIGQYGTMSRGASRLVVENSVYANAEDPIVAKDPDSKLSSQGNLFIGTRGRRDHTGATFDPSTFYAYKADPVDIVAGLVPAHAGPLTADEVVGRRIRVALDGSGDTASISAAVGAAARANHPVTVIVAPGNYREAVRLWPNANGVTLRGETGDATDVVLEYDLPAGGAKFYGGTNGATLSATLGSLATDVRFEDLTIVNNYDEKANGPSQALALRTTGDRTMLDNVRLLGNQDTFLADTPAKQLTSRVYVRDSYVEGDVDFVYGRATAVFERSTIHSLDRASKVNGYVTAASTPEGRLGFLFTDCRFTSPAAPGTVFLGRPWHPSSDPLVDPAVVVRNSWLGPHIGTPAWTDMSGYSWRDAEFFEHHNTGPGAVTGVDGRPQLSESQADAHTRSTYLTDWNPRPS